MIIDAQPEPGGPPPCDPHGGYGRHRDRWTGTASAHAHLISSTPKDTSTVTGPLTEVTLKFGEAINPSISPR
jgi:CopC domain